jgi:hypothetical protein
MVVGINDDTGEVALDHAGELSDKAGDGRHHLVLYREKKVEMREVGEGQLSRSRKAVGSERDPKRVKRTHADGVECDVSNLKPGDRR